MIRPTRGYCLIEPEKAEEKTASGLYLPDSAQEKPQRGTILAVGRALVNYSGQFDTNQTPPVPRINFLIESPAEVGDQVLYNRWAGKEVKEEDKEYIIVKFDDILAVIE